MICAIYARKSTEQTGVTDEEKSVTRQIEHAKLYAAQKGWIVAGEHIYVDDGISGAEFVKRPGFIRLMNTLKPRPAFQFFVMSEESRFGREQIETAYALKQIMDASVRVFFYLEDRERTLDSALDKMMLSLTGFASEMERERAKQRTYDAMLRKAKAGHVTGGKVFGYDNKDIMSADGHRLHVLRVVNQAEAAIVRQIYDLYAGGLGIGRIAKLLNAEGVPAARQSPRGWLQVRSGRFSIDHCTRARSCGTSTRRSCAVAPRNAGSETRRSGYGSMLLIFGSSLRTISLSKCSTLENQREGPDHLSRRGIEVSAYRHGPVRSLWWPHADCWAGLLQAEGTFLRMQLL